MSLFISFEGGDGSGKSTQAQALSDRLRTAGVAATHVREPGSTALGSRVREWLKSGIPGEDPISHRAELLLFAAARAELVAKVIRPTLARPDAVVVADRLRGGCSAIESSIFFQMAKSRGIRGNSWHGSLTPRGKYRTTRLAQPPGYWTRPKPEGPGTFTAQRPTTGGIGEAGWG